LVFKKAYLFAFLYSFRHDVSKYLHQETQTTTGRGGIHELNSLQFGISYSCPVTDKQTDKNTYILSSLLCGPDADKLLAVILYIASRFLTAGP